MMEDVNYRSYAVEIEHILKPIFDCDYANSIDGVLDAISIYDNPYFSLAFGLASFYNYNSDTVKRLLIKDFIEKHQQTAGESIEVIGEKDIKAIINEYKDLIKKLKR